MDYTILTATSSSGLAIKVKQYLKEGWKPIGSHQIVEVHRQNRFSGTQHMDTLIEVEYSQTMIKE